MVLPFPAMISLLAIYLFFTILARLVIGQVWYSDWSFFAGLFFKFLLKVDLEREQDLTKSLIFDVYISDALESNSPLENFVDLDSSPKKMDSTHQKIFDTLLFWQIFL